MPLWTPDDSLPQVVFRSTGGDDAAALNAILADVDEGTRILLPDKSYTLGSEITVTKSNISIIGTGQGQSEHEPTRLQRSGGASAAAVIKVAPTATPPYSTWPLLGGGLYNLVLDANGACDYALHLRTVSRFNVSQVWASNGNAAGIYIDTHTYALSDSYNGVSFCVFDQTFTFVSDTANGMEIIGQVSPAAHKVFGCTFKDVFLSAEDGNCLDLDGCDDLEFHNLMTDMRGTGKSVALHTLASSMKFTGSAGIDGQILGEASGIEQTRSTLFLGLGTEDVTGVPEVEKGARVRYVLDTGRHTIAPDPRTYTLVRDDFLTNQAGEFAWTGKSSGGSGSEAKIASVADHPGICEVTTAAAVNASQALVFGEYGGGSVGTVLPSEAFEATFIFKAPSIDDVRIRVGLLQTGSEAGDTPSQGIYLEYIDGTDTNWQLVTLADSSETRTDSGIAASTSWTRIALVRKSPTQVGMRVGTVVNDNTQATTADDIPTTLLNPTFAVKSLDGSAKTVQADLFQLEIIGLDR